MWTTSSSPKGSTGYRTLAPVATGKAACMLVWHAPLPVELVCAIARWGDEMEKRFRLGDHVTWNSEAGQVSGRIIKIHSQDVDYKGHTPSERSNRLERAL
jgi:hypothetical protein